MVCELTAIVLSRTPTQAAVPHGVELLNHCETFSTTEGIHQARRRALARVQTQWCFFLDSDDALPNDIESVLSECVQSGAALSYTDELIRTGKGDRLHASEAYSQDRHIHRTLLVHHLAVMRTDVALAALEVIPRGDLWIEMLLYFQIAKSGAAYVPRVGYHWHRGNGMHTARGILAAQLRAAAWCARNRT
jgi:hypothetical protein